MSPEKVMACIVTGHIVYIQKKAGITEKPPEITEYFMAPE